MPLITYIEERGSRYDVIDTIHMETLPRAGEVVALPLGGDEKTITFNLYMVTQIVHYPLQHSVKIYLQWKTTQEKVKR